MFTKSMLKKFRNRSHLRSQKLQNPPTHLSTKLRPSRLLSKPAFTQRSFQVSPGISVLTRDLARRHLEFEIRLLTGQNSLTRYEILPETILDEHQLSDWSRAVSWANFWEERLNHRIYCDGSKHLWIHILARESLVMSEDLP